MRMDYFEHHILKRPYNQKKVSLTWLGLQFLKLDRGRKEDNRERVDETPSFVSSSTPAGHHTGHFTGTDGSVTHTAATFQPVLAETLPANRAEIINTGGRLSY